MAGEVISMSNDTRGKTPNETRGKLSDLLHRIVTSESLSDAKQEVLDTVIFDADLDKKGNKKDQITIKEIYDNPLNIIRGLALEATDSFPLFKGIYSWIFLDNNSVEWMDNNSEKMSKVADDYYIKAKKLDVRKLSERKVTEVETDYLKDIVDTKGPDAVRLLDYYEKEKSISRNLGRTEFLRLMRDMTWACEDFGLDPTIYLPYFLGIAKKESNFKKFAWNKYGATGLFQHMTHYIDQRIPKVIKKMKKRGIAPNDSVVNSVIDQFSISDNVRRKDRSNWPPGVEKFAFGMSAQAYMTAQLTKSNFEYVGDLMEGKENKTEIFSLLYIAHNMGAKNLRKIMKGEPLSDWWQKRYDMLKSKKIISNVNKFAVRARQSLYGNERPNLV